MKITPPWRHVWFGYNVVILVYENPLHLFTVLSVILHAHWKLPCH